MFEVWIDISFLVSEADKFNSGGWMVFED